MSKAFKIVVVFGFMLGSGWISLSQRLGDYRDPSFKYEEGWATLFNEKDFSGWVVVLQNPDRSIKTYFQENVSQQSTFYIEGGVLCTTGNPNGYHCCPN